MTELQIFSLGFFGFIAALTMTVHFGRTSPWTAPASRFSRLTWSLWVAKQIQTRWGVERESLVARSAKISIVLAKYGVSAWAMRHFDDLSLLFWVLFWATLFVLEVLRKTAQFYIPTKWESVTLKLDSEHFWLIHLVILGSAELQIPSSTPWGVTSLVLFYVMFAGESRQSILAALDDVVSCAWALVAMAYLVGAPLTRFGDFLIALSALVIFRSIVRLLAGRAWLRRRFWWVAQFCLMTSLIIKSLAVLDVWSVLNP